MMSWVIIAIIVIAALFLLKFKETRHKLGFFVVLAIILFLVLGASHVYSKNKVDLTSFDGVMGAGKMYFSWLGQVFGNIGKVSSYVVKQDWGINESNNSSNG